MTEQDVRDVFVKNYTDGDLNEALMASIEQIMLAVIKEGYEKPESLPEIVGTIVMGKSHVALFRRLTDGARPVVSMKYLIYFDQIHKAMMDVVRYTRDNLEAMSPWFKDRFTKEQLGSILTTLTSAIEMPTERPANVRTFNSEELKLYEEVFNSVLIGIVGVERFNKYAKEFNKCAEVLRRCQIECRVFSGKVETKES